MKKIYLLLALMCIGFGAFAQNIIDEEYQDLKNNMENTYVYISPQAFTFASHFIPEDEEIEEIGNIKDFVAKVTGFQLVQADDIEDSGTRFKQGQRILRNSMDELISVRSNSDRVGIFVDEDNGIVYELAGIIQTDNEFTVFSLTGEIDLDMVSEMISKIDVKEMNAAKTSNGVAIDGIKVYPNPSAQGQLMTVKIDDGLIGGNARVYDLAGNMVHSFTADSDQVQFSTDGFAKGTYIIEVQKDDLVYKKKAMIIQ